MSLLLLGGWLQAGCRTHESTDATRASDDMFSVPTASDMGLSSKDMTLSSVDLHVTQSPCEQSDQDGDSFGTHSSCSVVDCDDEFPSVHPDSFEACNGRDDDCDGAIDESMPQAVCGIGQCRRTRPSCVQGRREACVPGEPIVETCNGLDDDCDGTVDESIVFESCGLGACLRFETCELGNLIQCVSGATEAEACDLIDNDCDGLTDEGFGASMHRVEYIQLSEILSGCSGVGWSGIAGGDCDTAIHRFCAELGCNKTGYGPAENSNGFAWITCLPDVHILNTTYAQLNRFHNGCSADGERQGMNCNAAINRLCADQGFVTGFGPVEQAGGDAVISCLGAGVYHHTVTYSQMSTFHTPCNGEQRIGPNCNAAIKRYCVSIGYRSGFGPNENSGDMLSVTCVP